MSELLQEAELLITGTKKLAAEAKAARQRPPSPRKANRQAYAEPYRELKTRVGFALTFMRKATGKDMPQNVSAAMIESAIEILEGQP